MIERARRTITQAQSAIAEMNLAGSAEGIRSFRRQVMSTEGAEEGTFLSLANFQDFFSRSECSDLLFHVQEHQFTLPEIKQADSELELEFLGFQLFDLRQKHEIDADFPAHASRLFLDDWHAFEEQYPNTFTAM